MPRICGASTGQRSAMRDRASHDRASRANHWPPGDPEIQVIRVKPVQVRPTGFPVLVRPVQVRPVPVRPGRPVPLCQSHEGGEAEGPGPRRVGWPKPRKWGPEGWRAQNYALVFPLPLHVRSFFLSREGLLVELWPPVAACMDHPTCSFGLLWWDPKRALLVVPSLEPGPQFHEKTPKCLPCFCCVLRDYLGCAHVDDHRACRVASAHTLSTTTKED